MPPLQIAKKIFDVSGSLLNRTVSPLGPTLLSVLNNVVTRSKQALSGSVGMALF